MNATQLIKPRSIICLQRMFAAIRGTGPKGRVHVIIGDSAGMIMAEIMTNTGKSVALWGDLAEVKSA